MNEEWNLRNIPPANHADLGEFCMKLIDTAIEERNRVQLPDRWDWSNRMMRGRHWNSAGRTSKMNKVTVNLMFANKNRIVANLTARSPSTEVVPLDGNALFVPEVNAYLQKWWNETDQKDLMKTSIDRMEEYGTTFEKPVWDSGRKTTLIIVNDIYSVLIAPGVWADIALEAPYVCFMEAMPIEEIEAKYNVTGILASDTYSILGEQREENRPEISGGFPSKVVSYSDSFKVAQSVGSSVTQKINQGRALIYELWVRDFSAEYEAFGNIRKITLCENTKDGLSTILSDEKNPNINPAFPVAVAEKSFLFKRFPIWKSTSYEDTNSTYGFPIAEQVGDLAIKIDEIFSKMISWSLKVMAPIFICPQNIGITDDMIRNRINLVLRPNRPIPLNSIGYIQTPNLPASFYNILNIIIGFFDRIYAIEEADRGVVPKNVIAASAIQALQARNTIMMQHKMYSTEHIVENRGKAAISMLQNFYPYPLTVSVDDEAKQIIGTDLAGREFNFVVESGSTLPRTGMQVEALAERAFQLNAIDRQAYLESIKFPGWRKIVERVGEGQLGQALHVLVQAGLPQEMAVELKRKLLEPQGGPGGSLAAPEA